MSVVLCLGEDMVRVQSGLDLCLGLSNVREYKSLDEMRSSMFSQFMREYRNSNSRYRGSNTGTDVVEIKPSVLSDSTVARISRGSAEGFMSAFSNIEKPYDMKDSLKVTDIEEFVSINERLEDDLEEPSDEVLGSMDFSESYMDTELEDDPFGCNVDIDDVEFADGSIGLENDEYEYIEGYSNLEDDSMDYNEYSGRLEVSKEVYSEETSEILVEYIEGMEYVSNGIFLEENDSLRGYSVEETNSTEPKHSKGYSDARDVEELEYVVHGLYVDEVEEIEGFISTEYVSHGLWVDESTDSSEEKDEEVSIKEPISGYIEESDLFEEEENESINPFWQDLDKPVEQKSSENTVSMEDEGYSADVPSDIRMFLRQHPNSDMGYVLKFYPKKVVDKQLKLGRIYKRRGKLFI